MCSPKIMYFEPSNLIWCTTGSLNKLQAFRAIHDGENEIDSGQYNKIKSCEYVPTCCVLIKSNIFDLVGLMDEKYFVYCDDADWMFRAQKIGVKLIYTPHTTLYHKVSSSTGGRATAFSAFYGTRNRVYFIRKNISGIFKYVAVFQYFISIFVSLLIHRITFREFKWKIKAFSRGLFY